MVSTFGPEFEGYPKRPHSNNEAQRLIRDDVRSAGIRIRIYHHTTHTTTPHWKIVPDGSVHGGFELVGPVLKGEAGIREMKTVVRIASRYSRVGSGTGLHCHFGVMDKRTFNRSGNLVWHSMTSDEQSNCLRSRQVKRMQVRLNNIMAHFEPVIDCLVSPSRRSGGMCGGSSHSTIFPQSAEEFINSRRFSSQGPRDANRFRRYMKVNFLALSRHGTVEFRQHQGTWNAVKSEMWIKLCYRLFARSWQQEFLNVDIHEFPKTIDGLMDFCGLGNRIREWFRNRATNFNSLHSIRHGDGHPDGVLTGRSQGHRRAGVVSGSNLESIDTVIIGGA
jgi:hypothetical protein